jgi:1,4-alpha-glucan branching enzyme
MNNVESAKGSIILLLHCHLPYVRHPEYPTFLEENWLFEAITETYIPLLEMFERLHQNGISFQLTLTLSPSLKEMLADKLLQDRYIRHLEKLIELAEKEVFRMRDYPFNKTAKMYFDAFSKAYDAFENKYKRNILHGFSIFQNLGYLEIIPTCATHGFLPLLLADESKYVQLKIAVENYVKHFEQAPTGLWLPECGFTGNSDKICSYLGFKYTFVDTHGILLGSDFPVYGVHRPIKTPGNLYIFGRDPDTSKQVWSAQEGYPADANYREFYRDIGYDAQYDYIKPYLESDGIRRNVGLKYYRITGRVGLHEKQPYDPDIAQATAKTHAEHFANTLVERTSYINKQMKHKPIIVAPYDGELYGHWWFEGIKFLEFVFTCMNARKDDAILTTPSQCLSHIEKNGEYVQTLTPSLSSWGNKGYCEMWLNGTNDWIYMHLHTMERRMIELANRFTNPDIIRKRMLNQSARELLLAQSSDWPFLMTTGAAAPYAHKRFKTHVTRFNLLYDNLLKGELNTEQLAEMENQTSLFDRIDYNWYKGLPITL